MKKYILSLIVLTTLLNACSKKNCCVLPKTSFISAEKNNTRWTADPGSSTLTANTIGIFGTNFSPQLEETLTLQFKASAVGKYSLKGTQTRYYNTIGGDVRIADYELDDTFANTVEVTAINQSSNRVAGTFNVKFKQTYPANNSTSLQFLNGKFDVALQK